MRRSYPMSSIRYHFDRHEQREWVAWSVSLPWAYVGLALYSGENSSKPTTRPEEDQHINTSQAFPQKENIFFTNCSWTSSLQVFQGIAAQSFAQKCLKTWLRMSYIKYVEYDAKNQSYTETRQYQCIDENFTWYIFFRAKKSYCPRRLLSSQTLTNFARVLCTVSRLSRKRVFFSITENVGSKEVYISQKTPKNDDRSGGEKHHSSKVWKGAIKYAGKFSGSDSKKRCGPWPEKNFTPFNLDHSDSVD